MTNIYFIMNLLSIGWIIVIILTVIITAKILLILDLERRIDDPIKASILLLIIVFSIITFSVLAYLYFAYNILGPNNFYQWWCNYIYN